MMTPEARKSDTPANNAKSVTQQAGRGAIWITVAKLWFIVSGMGLLFVLPRIGAPSEEERAALFGSYSVIVAVLNPLTMMLIVGTLQATSKFLSENPQRFGALLKRVLRLQLIVGLVLAGGFELAAPLIASILGDDSLTGPLRLAAVIIFLYSLYPVFVGAFNGLKRFHLQAMMDIGFATLKIGLILGLVYAGYGVIGAIGGFASTAVVMTAISAVLVWLISREFPEKLDDVSAGNILKFEIWIMLFALASNLLLNADLYIVKAMDGNDAMVGVYSAALQIARLPYVAVISITFILFPLISHATFSQDLDSARAYIRTATRYAFLIVGLMALSLAALSEDVLRLVFPPLFVQGSWQLVFLAFAYIGYAMLAIFATIITSSGRPQVSTLLVSLALAVSALFAGGGMWLGGQTYAAAGVMLAMWLGMAATMWYLHRWLAPPFPWATIVRLLVTGVILIGLSSLWHPENKLLIIVKAAGLFGLFLIGLVASREFSHEDLTRVKHVIGRD